MTIEDQANKVANCTLRLPKDAADLDFHIGYNPATGLPLVGDMIAHKESGRTFRVVSREWQADPHKATLVALNLEEIS